MKNLIDLQANFFCLSKTGGKFEKLSQTFYNLIYFFYSYDNFFWNFLYLNSRGNFNS